MFGVTANETGEESHDMYQEIVKLQKKLLSKLGLHGQVFLMLSVCTLPIISRIFSSLKGGQYTRTYV